MVLDSQQENVPVVSHKGPFLWPKPFNVQYIDTWKYHA